MGKRAGVRNAATATVILPPDPDGKWRIGLIAFGMVLTITAAAGYGWTTGDFEVLKAVVIAIVGAVVTEMAKHQHR